MSNELSIVGSVSYTNSAAPLYAVSKQFSIQADATGKKYASGSQDIANSEENLAKGDIGTIGIVIIKNLDPSLTVTMGSTTGQLPVTVLPGEIALVRLDATNAIVLASGVGPAEVEYLLIES